MYGQSSGPAKPGPSVGVRGCARKRGTPGESRLDLGDVGRLRALLALTHLETDALILVQGAETRGLDRGVMHEQVRTSIIGGDESETLFGVEPLDGALSHDDFLLFFVLDTDAWSLPGEVAMLFFARTIGGQLPV
ncbi:MAG: hypothetical protein H6P99_811 [Holophagaceae bacterium]|nr:hypothetical protein [Holophagaceae bacterium]